MIARHLSETELTEYAGRELTGGRREAAEIHLQQCPACSGALQQLQETIACVRTLRAVAPPADLRERLATKLVIEPAPALSCRRARPLMQEALDQALTPFAAGALQCHLDGCTACRAEFASLRQTTEAVRSLTPVAAPASLWRTVQATAPVLRPSVQLPWGARLRPVFATVAVGAVTGLLMLFHTGPQPVVQSLANRSTPATERAIARVTPSAPVRSEVSPVASGTTVAPTVQPAPVEIARVPAVETESARSLAAAVSRTSRPEGPVSTVRPAVSEAQPVRVALSTTREAAPAVQPAVSRERGPAALRVLKAVAKAAAYETGPHGSLASAGELLATLDSEAVAAGPPASLGAGSGLPGRGRESGESESGTRLEASERGTHTA